MPNGNVEKPLAEVAASGYHATHVDRAYVREGNAKPSPERLVVGAWNVEGLSEEKVITLQMYMDMYGIHILCLQEVRRPLSDYSITN